MKTAIIVVSVLCFVMMLPFSVAWGMIKGAWQEVEELFLSMFVW